MHQLELRSEDQRIGFHQQRIKERKERKREGSFREDLEERCNLILLRRPGAAVGLLLFEAT